LTTRKLKSKTIFEPDTDRLEEEEFYKSGNNFFSKDGVTALKKSTETIEEVGGSLHFFKQQLEETNKIKRYHENDDEDGVVKEPEIVFHEIKTSFKKDTQDLITDPLDDEISIGSISID
jgi:hypothetical protein